MADLLQVLDIFGRDDNLVVVFEVAVVDRVDQVWGKAWVKVLEKKYRKIFFLNFFQVISDILNPSP